MDHRARGHEQAGRCLNKRETPEATAPWGRTTSSAGMPEINARSCQRETPNRYCQRFRPLRLLRRLEALNSGVAPMPNIIPFSTYPNKRPRRGIRGPELF